MPTMFEILRDNQLGWIDARAANDPRMLAVAAPKPAAPKGVGAGYYDLNNWKIPEMSAADAAFVNKAYDPNRGNVRFDETVYGSGANAIRTYADAARTYATYQALRPDQKGYENAQNYNKALLHNTGLSDWRQATPRQLFEAIDNTFQGYQEDNKKENFGFDDIAGFVGPAVGFATGMPWLGAVAGGLSSGLSSGSLLQGALGAIGGYAAGSSNLFGADGFLGPEPGSLSNFFSGGAGGFVNPDALGLNATQLYNPASLGGPVSNGVTSLATGGFTNAGGLGLSAANLFGNAASGAWEGVQALADGGFLNPSALGTPSSNPAIAEAVKSLYNPPSLGGPGGGSNALTDALKKYGPDAVSTLADVMGAFNTPQAATATAGATVTPDIAELFGYAPGSTIPSSMESFFTPSMSSGTGGDGTGRMSIYRNTMPMAA